MTDMSQESTRATQVGIDEAGFEYEDFMVIGNTGQGKSTTADKLLIANPTGHVYEPVNAPGQQLVVDERNRQLSYSDITMWLAHGIKRDDFETHLKFLTYCRSKDKPHEEVNKRRSASSDVFKPTADCEVLSNETSKVRIMDVPGFFDGASILSKKKDDPEGAKTLSPTEHLDINNLDIMRKIIHIQTALAMKFNRILYFLPVRGPLERISAHLKLELKWMAHYFGTAIFKSMVLVATAQARLSKMPIQDEEKFPEEDAKMTKELFCRALKEVLTSTSENLLPNPPLIFISLTNTCEEILAKVKGATVQQEGLHLQIDPNTCAECGVKIGVVKGQRVTCYFGEDLRNAIPYEESTCHPFFVPRYSRIDKIWGGFMHIVTFRWASGEPWPVFVGEKCVACESMPNTRGCMQVGKDYGKGQQRKPVDHTSQVVNTADEQAEENTGTAVNTPTTVVGVPQTQNTPIGHEHENGGSLEATSAEASVSAVENEISQMDIHLQHSPNQSNMVERSADNPAWTERKRT